MQMQRLIIFLLFTVFFIQCDTSKKLVNESPKNPVKEQVTEVVGCNAIGVLRDFRNSSDCQFLIELADGNKLYPVGDINPNVPFYEGAGVKIGYKKLGSGSDVINGISCTMHDFVAEITCMEEYVIAEENTYTSHDQCQPVKNPYHTPWIKQVISKYSPSKLYEYNYDVGFLYEFQTDTGSIVFDCLGNEICNTANSADCTSLLGTLEEGELILVLDN